MLESAIKQLKTSIRETFGSKRKLITLHDQKTKYAAAKKDLNKA